MSDYKIELNGVIKSFGDKYVLWGFMFNILIGLLVVVIGGFGIGKLVMLKLILGIVRFDVGLIKVDG